MAWAEDKAALDGHLARIVWEATIARNKLTRWDKASSRLGFETVMRDGTTAREGLTPMTGPALAPATSRKWRDANHTWAESRTPWKQ